jgi:hypothetical protein
MYCDDFNDQLAYPNWGVDTVHAGWLYKDGAVPALGSGIPNPYNTTLPYDMAPTGVQAWQSGLWYKYCNNFKAYLCPVDTGTSKDYLLAPGSGSAPFTGRYNKLSTYVMDGAVTGFRGASDTPQGVPCKTTAVWSPLCYLIWEPDEYSSQNGGGPIGSFEWNDGANFPDTTKGEAIGLLHSKHGGNALALDGHVDFVTSVQFKQYGTVGTGSGPGGKTYVWWSPYSNQGN